LPDSIVTLSNKNRFLRVATLLVGMTKGGLSNCTTTHEGRSYLPLLSEL